MGVRIATALLLFGAALGARGVAGSGTSGTVGSGAPAPGDLVSVHQQTTRDKVYAKEQATRGADVYVKYCERCHTPEKVLPGKKPGPPVQGQKFFDAWQDRPLGELFDAIFNTMPSDGSAVLTPDQTLDVVAYILQLNGFPEGPAPLKYDAAMKAIIIAK